MKTPIDTLINLYLSEHIWIARGFPVLEVTKLMEAIMNTYKNDGMVFLFGNGGGANIAEHFASDLKIHPFVSTDKYFPVDIRRLRVHCLNESSGVITRIANDMGNEFIFTEQLKNYSLNEDDLVIAFSTSGNSPNILNALKYVKRFGAITACIGGRGGGKAKSIVDISIIIPGTSHFPGQTGANDNTFHIEDFQASISHMITGIIKEEISG